jgi:choline dehydrogenase
VIVGAGSAALAARLTEDPAVSVLLLEAGPTDAALELHVPAAFSTLFRGRYDWNYDTVPQRELEGRTIYWPRGKTLGGSSSLNAMMWIRGFAADYDAWAEAAGDTWSWDALAPYFLRAEATRTPPMPRRAPRPAAVEHQRDPGRTRPPSSRRRASCGIPSRRRTCRRAGLLADDGHAASRRPGLDRRRLPAPGARRRNLRVVTDALVRRVTFAERDGCGAAGDGRLRRHRRHHPPRPRPREVILCGGAINTPQLLMLSGIGPADHLASHGIPVRVDAPRWARTCRTIWSPVSRPRRAAERSTARAARAARALPQRRRGMLTSNVAEAYGFVRTAVADRPAPPPTCPTSRSSSRRRRTSAKACAAARGGHHGGRDPAAAAQSRHDPARLGRPDGCRDHRPRVSHRPRGIDAETLRAGLAECERLIAARTARRDDRRLGAAGRWRAMSAAERIELSLRRYSHTLYHPVGTARMGLDAHPSSIPSCGCGASRPAGRGRLGHADGHPRAHERARDRHRRARRRPHPRGLSASGSDRRPVEISDRSGADRRWRTTEPTMSLPPVAPVPRRARRRRPMRALPDAAGCAGWHGWRDAARARGRARRRARRRPRGATRPLTRLAALAGAAPGHDRRGRPDRPGRPRARRACAARSRPGCDRRRPGHGRAARLRRGRDVGATSPTSAVTSGEVGVTFTGVAVIAALRSRSLTSFS